MSKILHSIKGVIVVIEITILAGGNEQVDYVVFEKPSQHYMLLNNLKYLLSGFPSVAWLNAFRHVDIQVTVKERHNE